MFKNHDRVPQPWDDIPEEFRIPFLALIGGFVLVGLVLLAVTG